MKKSELETLVAKLRKERSILHCALTEVRQTARNVIPKGTNINPVWVIEKITTALTKVES